MYNPPVPRPCGNLLPSVNVHCAIAFNPMLLSRALVTHHPMPSFSANRTNRPARARHSCRRFPHLKVFFTPKKIAERFFWRHPLRVTARLDVSTVALTSQPSPLPTRQKKNYAKKKSRSDFFLASSTARHSSLGRIDRNFFLIIFFDFWWWCAARHQKS